jgi:CrcB protein
MFTTLVHVALGGAIGASLRYLAGVAALRLAGAGFPWATLSVNVLGSFLMGVFAVHLAGHRAAPFLMTGILGGFTTFSAFSLDTVALWQRSPGLAGAYVAGSVALSVGALAAGMALARGAA